MTDMIEKLTLWVIWFSGGAASVVLIATFVVAGFVLGVGMIAWAGNWLSVPQPYEWDSLAWILGSLFGIGLVFAVAIRAGVLQ